MTPPQEAWLARLAQHASTAQDRNMPMVFVRAEDLYALVDLARLGPDAWEMSNVRAAVSHVPKPKTGRKRYAKFDLRREAELLKLREERDERRRSSE